MDRSILLVVTLLLAGHYSIQAQHDIYNFLTIVIEKTDGEIDRVIYYPEGSDYQEEDSEQQGIAPSTTGPGADTYTGDLMLTVFPNYRKKQLGRYRPTSIRTTA